MTQRNIVERLTFIAAGVALAINVWLQGVYGGFLYGSSHMYGFHYPTLAGPPVSFHIFHADPYMFVGNLQMYLNWILLAFLVLKLFERKWVSSLILLIPPAVAIYQWIGVKNLIAAEIVSGASGAYVDGLKYTDPLRETTIVVWFLLAAISSLFLLQLLTAVRAFTKRKVKPALELA